MSDEPDTHGGAPAEVKDAFRAALERKKKQHHPHEDASQSDGVVNEAHRAADTKRVFRRKSI